MIVYLDSDFQCHTVDDGTMTEAETEFLLENVGYISKVTAMFQTDKPGSGRMAWSSAAR